MHEYVVMTERDGSAETAVAAARGAGRDAWLDTLATGARPGARRDWAVRAADIGIARLLPGCAVRTARLLAARDYPGAHYGADCAPIGARKARALVVGGRADA